jgi:hypothetical protein
MHKPVTLLKAFRSRMGEPNYAFERTVMWRRELRRDRAAAQRER